VKRKKKPPVDGWLLFNRALQTGELELIKIYSKHFKTSESDFTSAINSSISALIV